MRVIQFAESNCYGLQPHSPIECATYKAGTAFAFIALFSWLGSAFMVCYLRSTSRVKSSNCHREGWISSRFWLMWATDIGAGRRCATPLLEKGY
jgi:hypothetical protein